MAEDDLATAEPMDTMSRTQMWHGGLQSLLGRLPVLGPLFFRGRPGNPRQIGVVQRGMLFGVAADGHFLRSPLRLVALLAGAGPLVALVGCGAETLPKPETKPEAKHVIVISLDTTRRDHFGFYGNPWIRTPHFDALAAESIVFSDYMTVVSTTLASHASLFTGKYPQSHGVPRNGFTVNAENELLAEILEKAGYETAGFLGSFALDERFEIDQGFDHYDDTFDMLVTPGKIDQNQRRGEGVTDAVIEYLESRTRPEHLFVFAHFFDPHDPYDAPKPFDAMYRRAAANEKSRPLHPALETSLHNREDTNQVLSYAAEISYLDEQVGRLISFLRSDGILDEALLVIVSDHGENLDDGPGPPFDHGHTVSHTVTRGVGLIRLPGAVGGGTTRDSLVASIDILPTLLHYLELPIPTAVEGEPVDLLDPQSPADTRTRFAEATKPRGEIEKNTHWFNERKAQFVRRGRYKLVRTPYRGTEKLYDVKADPLEKSDLLTNPSGRHASVAHELGEALDAWRASGTPLPSDFEASQRIETIRRLRALGYLDPAGESP